MPEVQQRAGRRADSGIRHGGAAVRPTHEHGRAGGFGGSRRGTEVLGIFDPVEHDRDRILGPLGLGQVALREELCVRAGRADARDHPSVIARQLIQVGAAELAHGHPCAVGRAEHRPESLVPACTGRHQHLDHTTRSDRLGDRAPSRDQVAARSHQRTRGAHATTATARHPIPSPASPRPSGRVAFTEIRSIGIARISASRDRIS